MATLEDLIFAKRSAICRMKVHKRALFVALLSQRGVYGKLHSGAGYVGIAIYRSRRRSIEKLIGLKIVSEQIGFPYS